MSDRTASTLKVVHFSPVAFGEDGYYGGGERYPFELARAMAGQSLDTSYVTFGTTARRRREGGLRVVVLPVWRRVRGSDLNPVGRGLIEAVRRADVVHLHQWETLTSNLLTTVVRLTRGRVFVTDHGGQTKNLSRLANLSRLVHGFLPVSEFSGSFYDDYRWPTRVIWGGVDTELFRPDPQRRRSQHALFVGRLLPHKGVDELVSALPSDIELRIVGRPYDSGFLDHLRRLAEAKHVSFVTDASDAQILHEYQSARAIVLPSLHHPRGGANAPKAELLGLTLLEGMAAGLPAICTRTGGMPEVIEDGACGYVVEPFDRFALAAALRDVLGAPDWSRLSQAARTRIETSFTWDATARRAIAAYRALSPSRDERGLNPSRDERGPGARAGHQ